MTLGSEARLLQTRQAEHRVPYLSRRFCARSVEFPISKLVRVVTAGYNCEFHQKKLKAPRDQRWPAHISCPWQNWRTVTGNIRPGCPSAPVGAATVRLPATKGMSL